jgi:hypothetical protein
MIGADTSIVTDYGKPFTAKGFGKKMRGWCDLRAIAADLAARYVNANGKEFSAASVASMLGA